MARFVSNSLVAFFALMVAAVAAAQGVQTGSIQGVVKDATGLVVAQATIHANSPAQLGSRDTASDAAGAYQFQGLAPGLYTLTFEFTGFQTVTSTVQVSVGAIARLDVALPMPTVTEAVIVTAAKPSVLTARGGGFTVRTADLERLPTGRTPSLVAELAPGLTNNTPNVNQVAISGAVAYDNVFLLDGVDIGDNLFARPDDLFVEEAIEETQVLTSAVSAEYGRFSGGVVNAVTKRGGDLFSGSVRSNLSNAAWTNETPFEEAAGQKRQNKMDRYYEGTFGGPLARNRAWFFFAGDRKSTRLNSSHSRRSRMPSSA